MRFTEALCSFVVAVSAVIAMQGCSQPPTKEVASMPPKVTLHPIFATTVTGISSRRPAVQVEILDEREGLLTTAELYLSVQSSRSPADTAVLFPLNMGTFAGIRSRFIQIPFEVDPGDVLLINLLDEDKMTDAEQKMVLEACRMTGYCVKIAGAIYGQESWASLVAPAAAEGSSLLGKAIIEQIKVHQFENFGAAEFIVPDELPAEPNDANRLTIIDDANYARVVLKVYAPEDQLKTGPASRQAPSSAPKATEM